MSWCILLGFCDWIIFDLIMALSFFPLYRIYSEQFLLCATPPTFPKGFCSNFHRSFVIKCPDASRLLHACQLICLLLGPVESWSRSLLLKIENLFPVRSLLLKIENRFPVNNLFGIRYFYEICCKASFYEDFTWDGFLAS
jgi:hypothetical protein